MFKIFDRYLLREWMKPFAITLLLTIGILILEDMYRNLQNFIEWNTPFKLIVAYYSLLVPNALSIVIPIAFLISLVFCLNHLYHNNEIVALKVSGLKLLRITRGFWLVGAFLTVSLFILNAHLMPWSLSKTKEIKQRALFSSQSKQQSLDSIGMIYSLTFDNHKAGRFWFINRFSEYTSRGYGLTLSFLHANGSEKKRFVAEEVIYQPKEQSWTLLKGKKLVFNPITGEIIASTAFDQKTYQGLPENPRLLKNTTEKIVNLSLSDLKEIIRVSDDSISNTQIHAYKIRYQNILAEPMICLLVVGIVIPFTLTGVRINPILSIAKTAGLFASYYFLQGFVSLIGEQLKLYPIVIAWLPNFILAITTTVFFKSLTRE